MKKLIYILPVFQLFVFGDTCAQVSNSLDAGPTGYLQIDFEVVSPFRLFKNKRDQVRFTEIALESKDPWNSRLNIETMRREQNYVPETYFNSSSGSYELSYVNPSFQVIKLSVIKNGMRLENRCSWQIDEEKPVVTACIDYVVNIPFENDLNNAFVATAKVKVQVLDSENLTASTIIKSRDFLFVAIGDSYMSGEGNPDSPSRSIPAGDTESPTWQTFKPAEWWDENCHRSLYAWPTLFTLRWLSEHPKDSATFISRACSGALIRDIVPILKSKAPVINKDEECKGRNITPVGCWGRDPNSNVSQVEQIQSDINQRSPDFVFFNGGGNDFGFSDIIREVLLSDIKKEGVLRKDVVNNKLDALRLDYEGSKEVKGAMDIVTEAWPNAIILHANYPDPIHREWDKFCISGYPRGSNGTYYYRPLTGGLYLPFARIFGLNIENKELGPLFDNIIVPLTGKEVNLDKDSGTGIRQWSEKYAEKNSRWIYVGLRSSWKFSDHPRNKKRSYDQRCDSSYSNEGVYPENECPVKEVVPRQNFAVHGYCRRGNGVDGSWFLTLDDSTDRMRTYLYKDFIHPRMRLSHIFGTLHPNIFGQNFNVHRAYMAYSEKINSKGENR